MSTFTLVLLFVLMAGFALAIESLSSTRWRAVTRSRLTDHSRRRQTAPKQYA